MKVRMQKEPSTDGWHKYIVESKSWWFPFWITRGVFMVDPYKNNERQIELQAVIFAEQLLNPVSLEIQ